MLLVSLMTMLNIYVWYCQFYQFYPDNKVKTGFWVATFCKFINEFQLLDVCTAFFHFVAMVCGV
jgi:hypothetical protein